jgi:hypothetical protein
MAFDTAKKDGAWPAAYAASDSSWRRFPGDLKSVEVTFENGVPVFTNERLLNNRSDVWAEANARSLTGGATASKISSYKTVIRDEGGVKNISWRRTSGGPWTALMDASGGGPYTDPTGDYNLGLTAALAGDGIAAMAKPLRLTQTFTAGTWYLIWDPLDAVLEAALGLNPIGGVNNNKRFTVFQAASAATTTTGWAMEAVDKNGGPYIPGAEPYYEWEVTIDVDTQKVVHDSEGDYTDNGNFSVELQATDITNPVNFIANKVVQLDVDNYYPMGTYTGNSYAAGESYTVQGSATDAGTGKPVQGVWKVLLWFEKGGTRYDPVNGTVLGGISETVTAAKGRYVLPAGPGIETPAFETVNIPNAKTISNGKVDPSSTGYMTVEADYALDATATGFARNGDGREWYVRLNVSKLAADHPSVFSGPVPLKYLVYDNAGNASVYEQTLLFRENAPVITAVTLGTDLRNNTALQGDSSLTLDTIRGTFPSGWADSQRGISSPLSINYNSVSQRNMDAFTVRNNLLAFEVRTSVAKTGRKYRVYYVTGEESKTAAALDNGSVYTIQTEGGTNWDAVGAPPGWKAALNNPGSGPIPFMASGTTPYGAGTANLLATTGGNLTKGEGETTDALTAYAVFDSAAFAGIADSDNARFVIKVWDGDEGQGIADFVVLNVKVRNTDDTAPGTVTLYDLNPDTEGAGEALTLEQAATPAGIGQNRTRGGLYNTDVNNASLKRSGHIEPRSDTGFTNAELGITGRTGLPEYDTVSGSVILRGYAEDDIRVGGVTINIGGTDVPVLEAAGAVSAPLTDTGKTGLLAVPAAQNGRVFYTDTVDLSGHRVEWAYLWNTQGLPSAANTVGDTALQVTAVNASYDPGDPNPDYEKETLSLTVTRAPYVTGIARQNASWASDRSAQGWYGFSRGETVTVTGFNFKGSALTLTVPVTANPLGTAVAGTISGDTAGPAGHSAGFTIPATAKSGRLAFSVGTTASVNAVAANRTIRPWNAEMSMAEGTDLWDDQVSAHVWQSDEPTGNGDRDVMVHSGGYPIEYPAMSVDPATGNLYGLVTIQTTNGNVVGVQNNVPHWDEYLFTWRSTIAETGIHVNNGGRYVVYNVDSHDLYAGYGWSAFGGIFIKAPSGGGWTGLQNEGYGDHHYLVERAYYDQKGGQFASPHIVTYLDTAVATPANRMRMHVSYYDSDTGSIKYRHFQEGVAVDNSITTPKGWINLDGGEDAEDIATPTVTISYNVDTAANPVGSHHEGTYIRTAPRPDGWVEAGDKIVTFANAVSGGTTWDIFAKQAGYYKWENGGQKTVDTMVAAYTTVIFSITNGSDYNVNTAAETPYVGAHYIRTAPRPDGWVNVGDKIVTFASVAAATGGTEWDIFAKQPGYYEWKNDNKKSVGDMVSLYTTVIFSITNGYNSRIVNYGSRPTSRHDAGFYNAIDVTGNGYPVVVYQDQTAGTLKLAGSNSVAPTTAADWTVQNVFPAGDPNGTNVGDYVSFRIDPVNDRIHIVAVRGSDLVYITGLRNAGTGAYTFDDPSVVVDSPGGAGKWVDMSLDSTGNPYITYRVNRGMRMVFKDGGEFDKPLNDLNGNEVTGWEAMYIFARYQAEDNRLDIENIPAGVTNKFWHAAVGYLGRDPAGSTALQRTRAYRLAYYVKY